MGGNEWAEKHRRLGTDENRAAPGPWKSVPWQRAILDDLADPLVEWLVILKATQVGVSELVRCAIGRWALLDPGDVLWVMTTEIAARKAMKKLRAMFENTPALRHLISGRKRDSTLLELVLTNGMRIVIGWAGSAQSLSSYPFRRVILDEAAKYAWSVQGEGSPLGLAEDRTKVFGRTRKVVILSSPKHDGDIICTAHRETRDRRSMRVPCPSCHHLQAIDFDRARWSGGSVERAPAGHEERVRLAEQVEREQSAWIPCVRTGCAGRIQPARAQYAPGAGWQQEEPVEPGRRRAYQISELFHWETTLSDLVGKFLRASHPRAAQTFTTGSLGRAHRNSQTPIDADAIAARAIHPAEVPNWAVCVLAAADTQKDGWWYSIRAWGKGGRSRGLDWGFAASERELLARALKRRFPVEGSSGAVMPVSALGIDTGGGMKLEGQEDGSRTKQVYELARAHEGVILIKGEGDQPAVAAPWREGHAGSQTLYLVNATFYGDQLAALIRAQPVLWEECVGSDAPDYTRQMASEHRVQILTPKGTKWVWEKRSAGVPNHLWDCARYQVFLADLAEIEPEQEQPAEHVRAGSYDEGPNEEPGWWDGRRRPGW
jgi:phage terminase large subunit GpA-like protein